MDLDEAHMYCTVTVIRTPVPNSAHLVFLLFGLALLSSWLLSRLLGNSSLRGSSSRWFLGLSESERGAVT